MILHLKIRLLDNRFHGRRDRKIPEWPPSPLRVFQALLAGAKAAWPCERADAFAWLEKLSPPIIYAPVTVDGQKYKTFVPNNYIGHERVSKVIQPKILPPDAAYVEYFWEFDERDRMHAGIIADCARHIRALGWGIDMAVGCGELIPRLPVPAAGIDVYSPQLIENSGGVELRVPQERTLESLEQAHKHFLRRVRPDGTFRDEGGAKCFDVRMYAPSPTRPYCAFGLREVEEDESISIDPGDIKILVGLVRGALGAAEVREAIQALNIGNQRGEQIGFDRFIYGHPPAATGPRLSILALPSVGNIHADARVRRIILAEPFGGDGRVSKLLAKLLNGQVLQDERNVKRARLVRLRDRDDYINRWYIGPSKEWSTVSPVLLPGFDGRTDNRGNRSKKLSGEKQFMRALDLVKRALRHAEIAVPANIEISPVSWWPHVPHARAFVPREKLGPCPRYHVKLTFERSFTGPLSLGRQRHAGLGVFAALNKP